MNKRVTSLITLTVIVALVMIVACGKNSPNKPIVSPSATASSPTPLASITKSQSKTIHEFGQKMSVLEERKTVLKNGDQIHIKVVGHPGNYTLVHNRLSGKDNSILASSAVSANKMIVKIKKGMIGKYNEHLAKTRLKLGKSIRIVSDLNDPSTLLVGSDEHGLDTLKWMVKSHTDASPGIIDYIEPNAMGHIWSAPPNDPALPTVVGPHPKAQQQWALENPTDLGATPWLLPNQQGSVPNGGPGAYFFGPTPRADVMALNAWQSAFTVPMPGTPIIVAVVDTGVDLDAPDFQGQLIPGYNAVGTADSAHYYPPSGGPPCDNNSQCNICNGVCPISGLPCTNNTQCAIAGAAVCNNGSCTRTCATNADCSNSVTQPFLGLCQGGFCSNASPGRIRDGVVFKRPTSDPIPPCSGGRVPVLDVDSVTRCMLPCTFVSGFQDTCPSGTGVCGPDRLQTSCTSGPNCFGGLRSDAPTYCFQLGTNSPYDVTGHGSTVASIVAATTNNGIGMAGMANTLPVKIMPINVFDENDTFQVGDLISGLNWAMNVAPTPPNIFQFSLGMDSFSLTLKRTFDTMVSKNILGVMAAGNTLNYISLDNLKDNGADPDSDPSFLISEGYNSWSGYPSDFVNQGAINRHIHTPSCSCPDAIMAGCPNGVESSDCLTFSLASVPAVYFGFNTSTDSPSGAPTTCPAPCQVDNGELAVAHDHMIVVNGMGQAGSNYFQGYAGKEVDISAPAGGRLNLWDTGNWATPPPSFACTETDSAIKANFLGAVTNSGVGTPTLSQTIQELVPGPFTDCGFPPNTCCSHYLDGIFGILPSYASSTGIRGVPLETAFPAGGPPHCVYNNGSGTPGPYKPNNITPTCNHEPALFYVGLGVPPQVIWGFTFFDPGQDTQLDFTTRVETDNPTSLTQYARYWLNPNGTSFASPHVSGTAAMLMSVLKGQGKPFDPVTVRNLILNTGTVNPYLAVINPQEPYFVGKVVPGSGLATLTQNGSQSGTNPNGNAEQLNAWNAVSAAIVGFLRFTNDNIGGLSTLDGVAKSGGTFKFNYAVKNVGTGTLSKTFMSAQTVCTDNDTGLTTTVPLTISGGPSYAPGATFNLTGTLPIPVITGEKWFNCIATINSTEPGLAAAFAVSQWNSNVPLRIHIGVPCNYTHVNSTGNNTDCPNGTYCLRTTNMTQCAAPGPMSGVCTVQPPLSSCSQTAAPACGCNGVTNFVNDCISASQGESLLHEGYCGSL